jgi:hypothetical protein
VPDRSPDSSEIDGLRLVADNGETDQPISEEFSIFRRDLVGMIHYQDFDRAFSRLQLQSELLLGRELEIVSSAENLIFFARPLKSTQNRRALKIAGRFAVAAIR